MKNVLLLLVDDLRADLGCYGKPWARTPFIDELSRSSSVFLQAHAAVANCAPSRSSILTGLRPDTHGVLDLTTHIRDRHPRLRTLPQHFREAGYLAVSYGKIYHQFLDDASSWSPQSEFGDGHSYRGLRGKQWSRAGGWSRGWSYNQYVTPKNRVIQADVARRRRRGHLSVGINSQLPRFEIGPALSVEDSSSGGYSSAAASKGADASGDDGSLATRYTDARIASDGIAALSRLRGQPRPWLLALGFIRPHLPFIAPSNFWDAASGAQGARSAEAVPAAGLSSLTAAHLSAGDGELYDFSGPRAVHADSSHGRDLSRAYAAAVSFVDSQVGRVLRALDSVSDSQRAGAYNSTVVVLLSDHGWKLGHHGAWGKHTLTAADTHVPFLIRSPGFAPKRIHAPVELIDLFPTLCELAHVPLPSSQRAVLAASAGGADSGGSVLTGGRRLVNGTGISDHGASEEVAGRTTGDGAHNLRSAQQRRPRRRRQRRQGHDDDRNDRRLAQRHRRNLDAPPLEGRSLVPLMRRPTPRSFLSRAIAFSQWPFQRHGERCMGYGVRTQGWLLIQWTTDWRDAQQKQKQKQQPGRVHCASHADLFRDHRNDSREGVQHEVLVPRPSRKGRKLAHPAVVHRMRQRLRLAMPSSFGSVKDVESISI